MALTLMAIRIAVSKDDFGFGMHEDVAIAIDKAASALSRAGYAVEEVEPPLARETGEPDIAVY